ncbi:MAG TPA: transcription-repair coupling factor [Steroidobacteraceae bacterium]|nr:transcription-repair coupling factor [Steroidobacteraceae bacterium]
MPSAERPSLRWHQLYGSAPALAIAEAMRSDSRLYVIVADGARELERLSAELRFYAGDSLSLLTFPDWEVLPYDLFSPHPDITSDRLRALYELPQTQRGCLVVAADTLMQRLPPRSYVQARSFELKVGQKLGLEAFRQRLVEAGYASVGQVTSPGEFAMRGSLLDVYPMGSADPLRVDLFDEDIEAIRRFDPETQRSLDALDSVRLLPAREVTLDAEGVKGFRRRFRTRFEGDPTQASIYRGVSEGLAPPGIEFYLPLFFDETATLFDYLPKDAVIVRDAALAGALVKDWHDIETRYEDRRHDIERPVLTPGELFLSPDELEERIARFQLVTLDAFKADIETGAAGDVHNFPTTAPRELRVDPRAERPFEPLASFLQTFGGRVLVTADSPGRREVLQEMLRADSLDTTGVASWDAFASGDARLALTIAPDVQGLTLTDPPIAVISEAQLFGARARQERRRKRAAVDPEAILRDLQNLTPGAPVVHEEYGVGRYVGLQPMEVAGQNGEFLVLEYMDGDRVYVPVHSLHLVTRYTGAAPESAPLHKLGTDQWAKARKRAAEQIRDVAAELLDLYARRKAQKGISLHVQEHDYQAFANAFPFEETADQAEAIRNVLADLKSDRPMDRIVCGDVGFGKTEVAMRAAFVAVQSGKQVAVLVPTTLLAQQHLANFRDRFADWPVRIESLSRFGSGKETTATIEGIERGTVDIVIATHRLLHAHVRFKDLGLIIVDEEHRFGVRDKERLQALRAEVHVLTLTATPIPRTLNMALGGLRDLSLITTPPAERLAIKTFVTEWHGPTLREAALRELRRGGQIYFIHNEVRSIEKVASDVQELVPEASVRIGHGQMRERDLEQLMVDFYHRRFNLLVCTTIVESGIDVPSANTIMINRAERMGLAQLHQLRGRVGRSHHRAYAYLIAPPRKALSADAAKRLEAIESMEELGAGFVLATHDLEIRGAGELLGERQSGQMTEIGLALYLDLLDEAVKALKEGREPALDKPLAAETEVELRVPAFLPATYIGDVHVRLALYKRIAAAESANELDELNAEIIDRFSMPPPQAQALLRIARLKLTARALGIRRLDLGPQGGTVTFEERNRIDPAAVIRMLQKAPREYRLEGPLKLRITRPMEKDEQRFEFAADLMKRLELATPSASTPPAAVSAAKSTTSAPPPPATKKPAAGKRA